jgi:hypothetical protein
MRYDFLIDHDRRWLTIVATDPVSLGVAAEVLQRQAAEGAWSYRTLVDLRLLEWAPTTNGVRANLDETQRLTTTYGDRGPVAVVATNLALLGMARMYSTLAEMAGAQIVTAYSDIETAEQWLRDQRLSTD